jgi:hypothetical protein
MGCQMGCRMGWECKDSRACKVRLWSWNILDLNWHWRLRSLRTLGAILIKRGAWRLYFVGESGMLHDMAMDGVILATGSQSG